MGFPGLRHTYERPGSWRGPGRSVAYPHMLHLNRVATSVSAVALDADLNDDGFLASGLSAAVTSVLANCLPGQAPAQRSAIDAVLGARMRESTARQLAASGTYNAALTWAFLHSGQSEKAAELAQRVVIAALQRTAGQAPPATQSACYSAVAEAFLLNGRLRQAAQCCRFAKDYAVEAADAGCRYRALGLLTSTLALSGEIAAAGEAAAEAMRLDEGGRWLDERSSWPLLMGLVLIGARAADVAGITEACERLDRACGDDLVARSVARYCGLVLKAVRQDNAGIIAASRLLVQGADARMSAPIVVDMSIALEAIAHLHLGDPGAALALMEGRSSTQDHSVCFELIRANAYLQVGDLRAALQVTEGCVKDQPDHSLATLVSVQLRRAIAYEGLGLHAMADAEFSRAVHLGDQIGALSATLGLPLAVLGVLEDRLAQNEPDFVRGVALNIPDDYQRPDLAPLDFELPQLTNREKVLVEWLVTDLSLAAIAARLHVSANTIKSQVQTLYRKLEVSSRSEAVLRLERVGLANPSGRSPDRSGSNS